MKSRISTFIIRILIAAIMLLSFSIDLLAQSDQEKVALRKEMAVKRVIQQFFRGLLNADTLTLKSTLADNVIFQTAYKTKEGFSILKTDDLSKLLKAVTSKNSEDVWEEKLLSYNVQIDGNMANVWTPYEFYFNNEFSHCGVNSFQLFHDGKWKIIYLIDTRRRKGCKEK